MYNNIIQNIKVSKLKHLVSFSIMNDMFYVEWALQTLNSDDVWQHLYPVTHTDLHLPIYK